MDGVASKTGAMGSRADSALWRCVRRGALLCVLTGGFALVSVAATASGAGGGPCGPPVVNPVACENTLPGDPPSDWGGPMAPDDPSILGFATSMSVNVGQTEQFKIKTTSSSYHIDILRLGYY